MNARKTGIIFIVVMSLCFLCTMTILEVKVVLKETHLPNTSSESSKKKEGNEVQEMINEIYIKFNDGTSYKVDLESNSSAQEFAHRLPLAITMTDLHSNEKYYFFDESFPAQPENVGTINKGDLMLYGDDCIVVFYDTFDTPYSYTKIGKILSPNALEEKVGTESVEITFTRTP